MADPQVSDLRSSRAPLHWPRRSGDQLDRINVKAGGETAERRHGEVERSRFDGLVVPSTEVAFGRRFLLGPASRRAQPTNVRGDALNPRPVRRRFVLRRSPRLAPSLRHARQRWPGRRVANTLLVAQYDRGAVPAENRGGGTMRALWLSALCVIAGCHFRAGVNSRSAPAPAPKASPTPRSALSRRNVTVRYRSRSKPSDARPSAPANVTKSDECRRR